MPRISDIVAATPSGQSIFGPSMRDIANQRKEQQRNAIAKILSNQNQQIMNRRNQLANVKAAREMANFGKDTFGNPVQLQDGSYGQPVFNQQGQFVRFQKMPGYSPQQQLSPLQKELEVISGVPFSKMTPEQKRDAYNIKTKRGGASSQNPYSGYDKATNTAFNINTGRREVVPLGPEAQRQRDESEQVTEAEREQARDFASESYDIAERLLNSPGLDDAVGPLEGRILSTEKDTVDFEIDLEFLISRLTKENLGIMKGVLSDNDIKILTNIGAGELKLIGSEQKMRDGLKRVMNKLAVAANRQIPYPEMQTSVGGKEVDLNGTRFTIQEVK